MREETESLLESAARLCRVGLDLEEAKKNFRKMVEAEVPYHAPEMLDVYIEVCRLEFLWMELEEKHLHLKAFQSAVPEMV